MIVRWTRRALGDLQRVAQYIADDNPLAATAFAAAVRDRAVKLQRFPLLRRVGAFQDTRELLVHRNYILTYRVRAAEVQALQPWHVARNRAPRCAEPSHHSARRWRPAATMSEWAPRTPPSRR